jgi:Undecaprenyl-phosphate galactose phosphotransferase WbaP
MRPLVEPTLPEPPVSTNAAEGSAVSTTTRAPAHVPGLDMPPAPASDTDAQVLARALAPWHARAWRLRWVKPCLVLADLAVIWLCFMAGRIPAWIRDDLTLWQALDVWWHDDNQLRVALFLGLSVALVTWLGTVKGHYTPSRRKPWWDEVRDVLVAVAVAAMIDAVFNYLGKWQLSRLWTGVGWAATFFALPLARRGLRHLLRRWDVLAQPYVLIGRATDTPQAAAALASEPLLGYTLVATVDPTVPPQRPGSTGPGQRPLVALTPAVREYLGRPGPYQVVFALGSQYNTPLLQLAQALMLTRDDITLIPALSGLPMYGLEAAHFFSHEVLLLRARNNLRRRAPQVFKRLLDLAGAATLLVLLSPLMLTVAWLIKREDGGPVFFVQRRIGRRGQPFPFIKFRSMVLDADAALERWKRENPELYQQYVASNFKLRDDPRITRVGRWIRRTSVDELPQLINVLRGDMSLVGPRPLLPRELPDYGPAIATYGLARPGITGLWQVSGRSNTTFADRIAMDLWYVRNWSLWYDIVILMRTVRVVLKQDGAM